ncbi:MAG: 3-phosphoshikimate 1-carboxyvinyltransferase [Candidatus Hydrogenedentes bacterium]|nr:3-phosphoshikimate 1-carboxyvinyltransferase [Candidatus Hydrogenedentota bacterium]
MKSIAITPKTSLDATVSIPGSKSCSARALVMAGLTRGQTVLLEPADCDDTDYMIGGLQGLGVPVTRESGALRVDGRPFAPPASPLFLGNSGTAVRFLAAACATLNGSATLDGTERMRERPILDLVDALRAWGVNADTDTACPPITVQGTGQFGGTTHVRGGASSQYLTGLLLVAPYATTDVVIRIDGELVSKPYVDLTLAMMKERGVHAENKSYSEFRVKSGQEYRPGTYAIEADASGASYFLAAAAIAGGRVRVTNLTSRSHQGDAQFAFVLEQMGCAVDEGPDWIEVRSDKALKAIDIDLNAMPDMAQTLAVTSLFADGTTHIRNVANLRIKETDRISATATELRKLGAIVEEHADGLSITPGESLRGAAIDTYDDHRMAMSFAMAGLRIPGVVINEPGCVSKTFPDFFSRFGSL